MGGFFDAALRALPAIAGSPYALVAYAGALLAYVVLGWRVARNRNLLRSLEKVPVEDRAKLLRAEMNAVVPDSISAEDWLRGKIHRYYFLAFLVVCLVIVVLAVLGFLNANGRLKISADVYQPPRKTPGPIPDDTLVYRYDTSPGHLSIRPEMRYLEAVASGAFVGSARFQWEFPVISIKVENNTNSVVLLNQIEVQVKNSRINLDPVLVISGFNDASTVSISNGGWGKVVEPKARLSVQSEDSCQQPSAFALSSASSIPIESLDDFARLEFRHLVPEALVRSETKCTSDSQGVVRDRLVYLRTGRLPRQWPPRGCQPLHVCVRGEVTYRTERQEDRVFRFKTLVAVEPKLIRGAVVASSYEYDLYLDAGRSGYVVRKSIAQEIRSRSTDHFLIRLATSHSANLELSLTLSSVSQPAIWTSDVNLTTFVPRWDAKFARLAGQKGR